MKKTLALIGVGVTLSIGGTTPGQHETVPTRPPATAEQIRAATVQESGEQYTEGVTPRPDPWPLAIVAGVTALGVVGANVRTRKAATRKPGTVR